MVFKNELIRVEIEHIQLEREYAVKDGNQGVVWDTERNPMLLKGNLRILLMNILNSHFAKYYILVPLSLVIYWIGQKVWIFCMMLQKNLNKLLANPIVIWNGQQSSRWLSGKEPTCSAGDIRDSGSISGSGSFPGGGCGNPLQYSCLENPMDRGAWWATVHGVAESDTTEAT